MRQHRIIRVLSGAFVLQGCFVSASDRNPAGGGGTGGSAGSPQPIGPVAHDALEAWPNRPTDVAPISAEEIAAACVAMNSCAPSSASSLFAIDFCVAQIEWSAERSIPMSNLKHDNERAEFLVRCLINAADCSAANQCSTGRDSDIYCEEDGCRDTGAPFSVTCDGSVATLAASDRTSIRDCARAFANCDPASPTGCSDRLFTACPTGGDRSQRCEGNIRLGCDGNGQVSFRDCERMGGICGALPEGGIGCVYGLGDAECTGQNPLVAACESSNVAVCVTGKRIRVPAPAICG